METISSFLTTGKESFFLLGPRGTGKSTYIRMRYPDALSLDLVRPDVFRNYSAYPDRLRETVLANKGKNAIVIDEIQKVQSNPQVIKAYLGEAEDLYVSRG